METFNPFTLEGKTVLVTGASSGIGRGIAVTCSKMGASVVVSGRNETRLNETLAAMEGGSHTAVIGDLSDFGGLSAIVEQFPRLDGIVHCAGIGERTLCKMMTEKDFDRMIGINLKAPILLQTEILRQKKVNRGGSIVFVASIAADSPSIGNGLYAAAKGGLISYAQCLEIELAPRLVRVNCISPAMVWTDLIFKGGITEEQLREDEKHYPLQRYGTPEDIAHLAVYLLSDASSWMTGSNVKITGGGVNKL